MAQITLYCEETPGLKLGPGITSDQAVTDSGVSVGDVIVFRDGFATFDPGDFPLWEQWVRAPGTPYIRVLGEDEGHAEGVTFPCPFADQGCAKGPFKSEFGLQSHLRTHAPKDTSNKKAKGSS